MHGLDGIQVLKKAKKTNSLTCVIILTGFCDMTSAIDALRLSADDYLLKPCDPDELNIRIERCLAKQEAFQKINLYEIFLPIYIYCKSIRDDTCTDHGKGKWQSMEEYIHNKSGTAISHTFCPQCRERAEKDMFGD